MSRAAFAGRVLAWQADPPLANDLAQLAPDTTDTLPL